MTNSVPPKALVAYGSETGNAEEIALQLSYLTRRLRIWTTLLPLNSVTPQLLTRVDVVMIVISTTGQGELPRNAQTLWKKLRSTRLVAGSLRNVVFTSFGLGDSSYPQFNWAHRKLKNRLQMLGAELLCASSEGDEQHPEGVDATLIPWLDQLRLSLLERCPLPDSPKPIPEDEFLRPRWQLKLEDESCQPVENSQTPESFAETDYDHVKHEADHETAEIVANSRVTPESHWQDVRKIDVKVPRQIQRLGENSKTYTTPVSYKPGDVVCMYPKNFPEDVQDFITLQGYTDIATKPLSLIYDTTHFDAHPPRENPLRGGKFHNTILGLLTNHLDIMSVPRRSFFTSIAQFASDETQKERLLEFAKSEPEFLDDYYDYTTRPRRSILEVLQEFDSVKIPYQYLIGVLPFIQARQFSIASADKVGEGKDTDVVNITLLTAIVKYRTVIKRIRHGVCSRYLASLQPGQRLRVSVLPGGLKLPNDDHSYPLILVGPGTGIAVLRSIIEHREEAQRRTGVPEEKTLERVILFYGGRNKDADFFFREEMERRVEKQGLRLVTAFSRDQPQKIYVQDRIRENADAIDALLGAEEKARIIVSGSSGKMPEAVRAAFVDVLSRADGKTTSGESAAQEATGILDAMTKNGLYQQETW
ncbi:electron transfer flavo protein beta-subunit [Saccharata proteae CBS 121410]|uniref:NADPH-dependent diflavin oxidoreductase 1 n=1 Tax=Saccharata proteae CBS 121410 TaxID=1314787 RepID=A0A9P4LYY7_9PEZI|nr:electron transfer flavo protein beta-subunit [Saccharata proteae CBS 121410]